jgi:hypothetical protein
VADGVQGRAVRGGIEGDVLHQRRVGVVCRHYLCARQGARDRRQGAAGAQLEDARGACQGGVGEEVGRCDAGGVPAARREFEFGRG